MSSVITYLSTDLEIMSILKKKPGRSAGLLQVMSLFTIHQSLFTSHRSIPILIALERTFLRYADILRLFLGEFFEFHTDLGQVQARDHLIQMFR